MPLFAPNQVCHKINQTRLVAHSKELRIPHPVLEVL